MMEYMLDTSAIGEIADGTIGAKILYTSPDQFHITHIQKDELAEAGDHTRILMKVVEMVESDEKTTEAMMWGISNWGSKWGAGEYTNDMSGNMAPDINSKKDVLIAETAIQNEHILVTNDKELLNTVNKNTPGSAITVSELKLRTN